MKSIRRIFLLVMVIVLLVSVSMVTFAETQDYDWANVNWEEVDFNEDPGGKLNSLLKWLREEATLEQHLAIVKYLDGAFSEGSYSILADRFVAEPVAFIKALAVADEVARQHVPVGVAGFWRDRDAFETVLSTVTLPEDATYTEMDLLLKIVRKYEELSGKEISNPNIVEPTEDSDNQEVWIIVVVAVIVVGLITAAAIVNKKKFG